ncbi:AraC family transcriptional regulator [Pediococcus cellicola]|nr:GyrI-like domain-containing protein [Pediococcus cellicola]GEL14718.1 SPBc2 prophage-derived putative transcriptional regulator YosT [Pediococcus cellicola]
MNIECLRPTRVAYFRRIGPYGIENNKLMTSFKNWVRSEGLFRGSTILGIALDDPQIIANENCRYDTCLIINKSKFRTAVEQRILPGGKYAVFLISHDEKSINEFYRNMCQIIDDHHVNMVKQPVIERYQQTFVDRGYCEILIPIK